MATRRQAELSKALRALAPMIPYTEAEEVKALASQPHMRQLPVPTATWLCLVAHVRHVHTDYDALLDEGYEREAARHFVLDDINEMLSQWQATRLVSGEPEDWDMDLPDPVEDHSGG